MRALLKYKLIIWMVFSGVISYAGNVSLSLDKDSILIGDHFLLSLSVSYGANERGYLPELVDSALVFDLIETYTADTSENTITQNFLITQFDAGIFEIGNIPALLMRENGTIDTLVSNSIQLTVTSIEVDTTQAIKAIKPVKSLPFPWKSFLKKSLYILAPILLFIALIIFYVLRKKKYQIFKEKPKTMLDFYEEAIESLQQLENRKLWQNDQIKEYYLGLSEILREYIEGRFGVQAMESTTDELRENLFLGEGLKRKVIEILSQSDLAKFAKFKPSGEENTKMMKLAKDFVRHTKPKTQEEIND